MTKFFSNKTYLYYLLLIGVTISFCGCNKNKCNEKQSGSYNFTPEELEIIPYHGHEVLIFQNLSGDSMNFSAGDRISNMNQLYTNPQDECQGNYYLLERNNIVISSNSNFWQFSLTLQPSPTQTSNNYTKKIGFEALIPNQSQYTFSYSAFLFDQDTITINPHASTSELIFHYTLVLGLNSFKDIYEMGLQRSNGGIEYWVNKIYYSIDLGIVGFSTNQNEIWYLVE
jgi:hypothetical protein